MDNIYLHAHGGMQKSLVRDYELGSNHDNVKCHTYKTVECLEAGLDANARLNDSICCNKDHQ